MATEKKINTANPEAITYATEELGYTILGGIRLEGLDRLRVTIKIEVINRKFQHYLNNPDIAALAIRQNLDLYSITQVEKLARLIVDRLEVGVTAVNKDLSDITSELESYRLQQIESKQQEQNKIIRPLTEAEKNAAIEFLKKKNLLQATNELIGRSGIVGEELNRLIMWLIYTSRKTAKPLHIISMGSSGTGKSHLQEKVGELIPEEDKIEITALTENAFYYFDKAALGHKLILIEDLDGIWKALYPLRELQSKQRISKTITIKDKNGNPVAFQAQIRVKGEQSASKTFTSFEAAEEFEQSMLNAIRASRCAAATRQVYSRRAKPVGVAKYLTLLTESLPKNLESELPSPAVLEAELQRLESRATTPVKVRKASKSGARRRPLKRSGSKRRR